MATGLSLSSTSNLSSGQKILVASAFDAFEPAAPNADLVRNERIPQGHKQWDVLTYARLSDANALTEGVDLAQSEQLVTNSLSITPAEHGIIATLSKRLIRRQGDKNVMAGTGEMLGASLRRRLDKDVIALYDGFSKSTPGASLALDITHFRGAAAYLMTDNDSSYGPAPMPYNAALHPEQISDIIADVTDTSPRGTTTGFTEELIHRWWAGSDRLYSIQIFNAANIERDSSGDSKGAIFNQDALVLVMANEAEATEQPDHSARVLELGIFQEWSEGERADSHGVEIYSDSAATI
jgi:hypothetical protein|tara:strand:- start:1254 stop:2138 length:885 start_codon:yes stop_codon:yes gene_type:complete